MAHAGPASETIPSKMIRGGIPRPGDEEAW